MKAIKENRTAFALATIMGSAAYWTISATGIKNIADFTLFLIGYMITIILLVTGFCESAVNNDPYVRKQFTEDALSICPKCGEQHIKVYQRSYFSRTFAHMIKSDSFEYTIMVGQCPKCGHRWYGGTYGRNRNVIPQ
jgi:rRNA maturation protein Nop10